MNRIVILILLAVLVYYVLIQDLFFISPRGNFTFLTRDDTSSFFVKDVDGYVESMNDLDVLAQGCKTKLEFLDRISKAADNFTLKEKWKCKKACTYADDWIRSQMAQYPGIENQKLANIPWKLSLTRGKANEEGLPHTRRDIIFLSDQVLELSPRELARTLVHEKIHVYERMFPADLEIWMQANGYKRYKRQSEWPNARSNPDVDGWVYLRPDGKPTVVLYTTDNPTSIDDVVYPGPQHPNTEHPFETLAYLVDSTM
jgi:hypothetical protein